MNKKAMLLLAFVVSTAGLCVAEELVSSVEANANANVEEEFKSPVTEEVEEEKTEEVAE